jgi:hypothetical protein
MVLGVQLLESLGPILWDFSRCTLTFVCDGHHVVWHALDVVVPPVALMLVHVNLMDELLSAFTTLFDDPTSLLPLRQHSHHIQLLPGHGTSGRQAIPLCLHTEDQAGTPMREDVAINHHQA